MSALPVPYNRGEILSHLGEHHSSLFGLGRLDELDDTDILYRAHEHAHDVADHGHHHSRESGSFSPAR